MAVYKLIKLAITFLALCFPQACHCWRASTADAGNPLRDFSKLRLEHPRPRPLVSPPSPTTIKSETNSNDYYFGGDAATQDGDVGFKPNSYSGGNEGSSSSSSNNYTPQAPMISSNSNGNNGPFSPPPYEEYLYEQSSTAASNHYHRPNGDDEMTRPDENNAERDMMDVDHEPSRISDHGDRGMDHTEHGDRGVEHGDRGMDHTEHGDRGVEHGDRGMDHTEHGDRGVEHGDRGMDHTENGDRGVEHGDRGVEHGDRGVEHGDRGVGHMDRGVNDIERGVGTLDDDSKNVPGYTSKPQINAQDDGQQPAVDVYFVPLPPSPIFLAEMEYDSASDSDTLNEKGMGGIFDSSDQDDGPDPDENNSSYYGGSQQHGQDQENNENSYEGSNRDRKQFYEEPGYGRFGHGKNGDYADY